MSGASRLESELAAYSPWQLAELQDTINILLDAASDGTVDYRAKRARIEQTLMRATEKRLDAEARAGRTAAIILFPVPAK